MSPSLRRLFALLPLGCLPLAHATTLESLIFLTDLDDHDPKDQIVYQATPTMGKWIGFDAFTGHQTGSMYSGATLEWDQFYDACDPNSEDTSNGGTYTLLLDVDGVFSGIRQQESPAGAGSGFRVPPPDSITQNKAKTTDDQVCGTCPDDGAKISRSATAELTGSAPFNGNASDELPHGDWRFSRDGDVVHTAYQTNIDLRKHDRAYNAQACDDSSAGEYKFEVADYRWGRQIVKFRVKGRCPGKYTLYYTIGQYQPLYHRFDIPPPPGSNLSWTTGANIKIASRQGTQRQKIEVTIGEDGWIVGEGVPFPTPPLPTGETWGPGIGYELITLPEQAEAYGVDLNRDANGNPDLNIWKDYAAVLEPVDCGCGGAAGASGGGPGSGGPRHGSVNFDVSLGALSDGQPAGLLSLRSTTVASGLLGPSLLELVAGASSHWGDEVLAVSVGNVLRQIRAPQTFVDIVATSTTSYEIRFYAADAGGAYDPLHPVVTPTGEAQTTWVIGTGTTAGSVSFSRGSSVWEFRNTVTGGTEMLRDGVSETRQSTGSNRTMIETRQTIDPVYGLLSSSRQIWRMENGQPRKIEDAQLDAGGNVLRGLVNGPVQGPTYQVDDQPIYWPGSSSSSSNTAYLDGSGDYQSTDTSTLGDLDGDQINEQLTSSTTESYPSNHLSYTHVIAYTAVFAHDGVNYKKEETRRAKTPSSSAWDSPDKRITTRWNFADGTNAGKTAWEFFPDGSATRWTYCTDTNGNTVTVQETGTPDDTGNPTAILYGTRSTTKEDTQGRLVSSEERDIATNLVFSSETVLARHPIHGTPTVIDRNGLVETREYSDCCGRLEKVTRQGLVRTILYDGLDREAGEEVRTSATPAVFVSGQRNELDALGRVRKTYQRLANGTERLIATADYDLAGKLTGTWSLQDGTVGYSETVDESGRWVKTTTRAESAAGAGDALEEVTITTGNGLPLKFLRNGVLITKWSYAFADEGYSLTEIKVGENNSENEYVRTVSNLLGEQLRVEYPFPQDAHSENEYDEGGRLIRQTDPDGVQTLFAYERDAQGEHVITALDMDQDGVIDKDASGPNADRITKTTTTYATRDGLTVRQTTTTHWIQDGDTPQVVSVEESAVDGSTNWRTLLGTQTTQSVVVADEQSGLRTQTVTLPDQTQSIRVSLGDRVQSETRKDASGTVVTSKSYEYDTYGRQWKITDARGTTTFGYHSNDLLQTVTTPDPGAGALVTTYGYNNRGAVTSITYPDAKATERLYWPDGSLKHAWGARTYPEYRTYDRQGRLKTLTTWQDYTPASHSGTGAAVTTWNYHAQRGWLETKRYQDNKGNDYTYTAAGRLHTRTWARTVGGAALVTTYGQDNAGELSSIDYSDTTPDVTHVYDRAGRLLTTTDAAGTLTRSYYPDNLQLAGEAYGPASGGSLLSGRSLTRTYDLRFRPQSVTTDGGYAAGYGYDSAGRLEQVIQGFHAAFFGYETGTSAHNKTTIKRVGVERVRNETVYDALGRIDLTRTIVGGSVGVLRDYTLDDAGQRTGVELEDDRRWAYGYDDLGQVTSAQKRLANNTTPLPGYSFGYSFDDIGNRTQTVNNARTTTYTPDLLNRYTSRQVAGAVDVRGEATTDAAVTISTTTQGTPQGTTRTGKDFYKELSYTNTAGAVSDTATITATRSGPPVQTGTEQRPLFLPQTPESFSYDDDGNLTGDGRWTYAWDAENRLIGLETKVSIATAFPSLKQKLTFAYDAQCRRIRKQVETWDATLNSGTGGWATDSDTRFLYDGWNLLTELDALNSNTLVRSYAWGLDLSGSLQGAGGVGGLLWANTPTHTFATSSDGNGNIVAWVNTASLAFAGRADYDAFGGPVMRTGVADALPFGFSSKYTDAETGLIYYGYRFYCPSTGRWLSRDPIGTRGGLNLYEMIGNDPINYADKLGLISYKFDKGNCTLNVSMTWRMTFNDWNLKSDEMDYYKWKAKKLVEDYFNNQKYACKPDAPNCPCPNGVKIKLEVRYIDGDSGYDFRIRVSSSELRSYVHGGSRNVELDMSDIYTHTRQEVVVHEAGHMLGLNHPGNDLPKGKRPEPNSDEDYDTDADSLMGRGMDLRMKDFQKAFCNQIKEPPGSTWTAVVTK